MNLIHLKYAVEVSKTGSITQAAENLYMGQPNLSKAIRELEHSLGITIFNRTSRGITPTKKGEEFLRHARSILERVDRMEAMFSPSSLNGSRFSLSSLRFGYISYAFSRFLSYAGSEVKDYHYIEAPSIKTIEDVAQGEFDLGIITYAIKQEKAIHNLLREKDLDIIPLLIYNPYILMSDSHPLALKHEIDILSLIEYTEIINGDIPSTIHLTGDRSGARVYLSEKNTQYEILQNVRGSFMLSAPLPDELLKAYHLVQRRSGLPDTHTDALIFRRQYRKSDADQLFIQTLQEICMRLQNNL